MWVADLTDAFFNWRVAEHDTWALGFFIPGSRRYGRFRFLPFGLKPAPGINDTSLKEILRLMERHTSVCLLDFVDDFLGSGRSESASWEQLTAAVDFCLPQP